MGTFSKIVLAGTVADIALRLLIPTIPKEDSTSSTMKKIVIDEEEEFILGALRSVPTSETKWVALLRSLSKLTRVCTLAHLLNLFRKGKALPLLVLMAMVLRFKIPGGNPHAKPASLVSHLFCYLAYRRVGLNLPPGLPLGNLIRRVIKDRKKNIRSIWRRHLVELENSRVCGKIYRAAFPFNRDDLTRIATCAVWVSDPDMVKQVMTDKEAFPTRGDTGFSQLLGEGLLGMETGPKWHKHRRIVSQFLSNNFLRQFSVPVEEEIGTFMGFWKQAAKEGKPVNAYYDLSMLTLDAIMRIAFGIPKGDKELMQGTPHDENFMAHGLDFALKIIILRTAMPWLKFLPEFISHEVELDKVRQASFALADRVFDQAMKRVEEKGGIEAIKDSPSNMLEAMLLARDEQGNPAMARTEMRDELITIRGAGHETTSNTLCWCLYYLQRNPDVLKKLRKELDTKVAGEIPTYDEAQDLAYTQQVVYEALRLCPTVPSFPRVASEDTKIGDYDIPKYSYVFVSQQSMNRDPKLWDHPDEFIPERFDKLPQLVMSKPVGIPGGHFYGFLPFGAGPRTCIGQRLAMAEAVQILASVAKNFDFTLNMDERDITPIADVTLGPKESGLWLKVSERHV